MYAVTLYNLTVVHGYIHFKYMEIGDLRIWLYIYIHISMFKLIMYGLQYQIWHVLIYLL